MAVTITNNVIRMTAAADEAVEQYTISAMFVDGDPGQVGQFVVKDAAAVVMWSGRVTAEVPGVGISFPGGLHTLGIEFDTVPTNAVLYAYLAI